MPQRTLLSNYDPATADTAFEDAKDLALEFEVKDQSAKRALYAALEALLDLVRAIPDQIFLQDLVERKGGKWGRVAQQNEFQPLVKLVFDGRSIGEASHSQYAKVLKYARILYDGIRPPTIGLAEWLAANGGIEGVYQTALLHVGGGRALRAMPAETKLEAAKRDLMANRRSAAFELTDDIGIEEGFVSALLWVGETGGTYVVRLLETDQGRIDRMVTGLVVEAAKKATIAAKPLFSLYRIFQATLDLTPSGDHDRKCMLVLDTIGDGLAKIVRLRSANAAYAYTTIEARVPHADLPVSDGIFELNRAHLAQFVRWFTGDGTWSVAGDKALTFSDPKVEPLELMPLAPTPVPLYMPMTPVVQRMPFVLRAENSRAFLTWYRLRRESWAAQTRGDAQAALWSPCLVLAWESGFVSISPYRMPNVAISFLEMAGDPGFTSDRFLDGAALGPVCELLDGLERDIAGWIIDTDERNAALAFDLSAGEVEFRITMPLVKNVARDHTNICELIPVPSFLSAVGALELPNNIVKEEN